MSWRDFWEVKSDREAYTKVVGDFSESFANTDEDVKAIMLGQKSRLFGTALEIGAGYGRLMKRMDRFFGDVYGVDISQPLINRSFATLDRCEHCHPIKKTDGVSLPFSDEFFHFVYSVICFQHMPTIDIVRSNIKEIARVLKPGGVCRIQTIHGDPIDRDDSPTGSGRNFETPEAFLSEFTNVGLRGTAELGLRHFQWIWVTAEKPS